MKRDIIVLDLDGTVCNSAHREHLARAREWEEFHAMCGQDEPHMDVLRIANVLAMKGGYSLVALTGRNEAWRSETVKWMLKHKLNVDTVLMRPDRNFAPDIEIKPALLYEHLGGLELALARVEVILEDRDKVVETWRNLGFRCWQTQPGGY